MDADEVGIALFSAHVQDTIIEMIQNYDQISEDFLSTPESEPYFRWEMAHNTNGNALHQMIYIFGSKQSFLTIMYGRPMTSGEEYDRLVDDAINTLVFEE